MAKLPSVTSNIPRDLRAFIDRVREAINGTGEDSLVTVRQLVASGIASANGSGGLSVPPAPAVTAAVKPTGFTTSGSLASVILSWDSPAYQGHSHTEIYAASGTNPPVSDATLVGMVPGNNFSHYIGSNGTRYYWIRFINRLGEAGPYNATDGTVGTTSQSPTTLLENLSGAISASELATDLANDVGAIDTIQAKYTVKVDNGGHISGYGFISTNNDATPTAEFGVRADNFFVAPPAIASATAPAASSRYTGMVWRDTSSDPAVVKYWTGTAWSTDPQTLPFIVRTSSGTINGATVGPGVYIDTAYIADATIQQAQIGDLTADVITSGLMNTVDFYGNTIAGTTMYLGGTITYNTDADGNNIGIASVSSPAATLNSSGINIGVSSFQINDGSTDYSPFQIINNQAFLNNAMIKDATLSFAKVADDIQSTNYNSTNNTGWKLQKNGNLDLNSATITAGTLQSTDGKFVIDLTNKTISIET